MIRPVNRLIAFFLGVALLAGGIFLVLEAVANYVVSGFVWVPGHQWVTSFETTPWSAGIVVGVTIGVAVLGLLLLVGELAPRRKRLVPFRTDGDGDWVLLRRSTDGHLSRRLAAQVPTTPIRARLHPRRRRWKLQVEARAAASSQPAIEEAARAELAALHAPDAARVLVKTRGGRR